MGKTYSELAQEIERLGGCDLDRDRLRINLEPGGVVAGRMRVAVTVHHLEGLEIPPMRVRRFLMMIKNRLEGHLVSVIDSVGDVSFRLIVEEPR